jgi:kynureninase
MDFNTDIEFAVQMDRNDALSGFRHRFYQPDPTLIYLDGNSLGRLLLKTGDTLTEVIREQWGDKLIESWNNGWYVMPEHLGNMLAPLIGASQGEVIVSDSTSVNLYKLAHGALKLRPDRTTVVSDCFNFPTDLYILQGILSEAGPQYSLVLADSQDGIHPDLGDLEKKITNDTALVVLSLVTFKSSYLYDIQKITEMAHQKGALMLWDLSHAAGAVPVALNTARADLAVGCTYKYLNGGPGSPAFLYVRKDLQEVLHSPVQGWFGHHTPFSFGLHFEPATTIRKYLAGTPPVLSMAAIKPGIDILAEAGIENLRRKSLTQGDYVFFLMHEWLKPLGFTSGSPQKSADRGSHISLRHPEAYRICQALINPAGTGYRIIPDFREPDIIRLGITPLYTTYTDLYLTMVRICELVRTNEFLKFQEERKTVT